MKRFFLFNLMIITLLIFFISCNKKPEPYSILEFKGVGAVSNYFKNYMTISYETDTIKANSILAGDGDLILYNENNLTRFDKNYGVKFILKTGDDCSYINGKIRSITIPEKDNLLPAFLKSDTVDFSQLEFISFGSKVPVSYMPFLTHLAKIKPDAGLNFENKMDSLEWILKIFDPAIILGTEIPSKDLNLLAGKPNLESLILGLLDSINTTPLPAMAELEQLVIAGESKSIISGQFLAKNSQLEKLSVISVGTFDCSVLKPLTNLKELMIFDCDTVLNVELIKDHKGLEVLIPNWRNFKYDITEKDLPALRWICFGKEVPQTIFESFIRSNPNLEVVEIIKNSNIGNLQSLQTLKSLYGLTIVDTLTDINTIKSLKNLKYLSLPRGVINDSLKKALIHQALPGTVLAANEGVCLGSGWLLLLVPFIILFRFVARKGKS
jgi:hypothetical protein